jgi:hypothetical protein
MELKIGGLTLSGNEDEVKAAAEKLGLGAWYYSDSKGWLLIEQMATKHLANAILKHAEIEVWGKERTPRELAQEIIATLAQDATIGAMVVELLRRTSWQ